MQTDRQRRGMFAALANRQSPVRRGARSFGQHVLRWAHDPELQQGARDLAVLGVAAYGLHKLPVLNKIAITKWRTLAPHGTGGRRMLIQWVRRTKSVRDPALKYWEKAARKRARGLTIDAIKKIAL